MIAMVAEHDEQVQQQATAVVPHQRSRMVQTEKDYVQHQRNVYGPIELNSVDDHVGEQHHSDVAPEGFTETSDY